MIHADFRKIHLNLAVAHKIDILSRDNEIFSIILCHFMTITFLSQYVLPPYDWSYNNT